MATNPLSKQIIPHRGGFEFHQTRHTKKASSLRIVPSNSLARSHKMIGVRRSLVGHMETVLLALVPPPRSHLLIYLHRWTIRLLSLETLLGGTSSTLEAPPFGPIFLWGLGHSFLWLYTFLLPLFSTSVFPTIGEPWIALGVPGEPVSPKAMIPPKAGVALSTFIAHFVGLDSHGAKNP